MTKPLEFETMESYLTHAVTGIKRFSLFYGVFTKKIASGIAAWREHLWFLERGLNIPYFMIYDMGCLLEGRLQIPNTNNNDARYSNYIRFVNQHSGKLGNVRQLIRSRRLSIEPAAVLRSYLLELLYSLDLSTIEMIFVSKKIVAQLAELTEEQRWQNNIPRCLDNAQPVAHSQLYLDLFSRGIDDDVELFNQLPELLSRHFFLAGDDLKREGNRLRNAAPKEKEWYRIALQTRHLDMDLIKLYRAESHRDFPYWLIKELSRKSLRPVSSQEETKRKECFRTIGRGDPPFLPSELRKPEPVLLRELAEGSILSYKDDKPILKPLNNLVVFALYLPPAEFSSTAGEEQGDVSLLKLGAALAAHDLLRFAVARGIPQIDIAFYFYTKNNENVLSHDKTGGPQASTAIIKGGWVRAHRKIADRQQPVLLTIPGLFPLLFYHTPPWKHRTSRLGYDRLALDLNLWLHWAGRQSHWDKIVTFIMGTRDSMDQMNTQPGSLVERALNQLKALPTDTALVSLKQTGHNDADKKGDLCYRTWQSPNKEKVSPYPYEGFRDWVIKKVLKT